MIKLTKILIKKNIFKNAWTKVQVYYESGSSFKTRRVSKGREKIWKLKKIGGDEETIIYTQSKS